MKIDAADTALPHMFLRGVRAPVGQKATFDQGDPGDPEDDSVTFEEVGTFVARARLSFAGAVLEPGDVSTEDVPYDDFPESGPFRYEADIAVWKPTPDIVVVDDVTAIAALAPVLGALPPPPYDADQSSDIDDALVVLPFGTVAIDRGTGFGAPVPLDFGWLPRGKAPRLDLAGFDLTADPWQLSNFDASKFKLPEGYDNAFQSGRPLAGQTAFASGDRLRFTDTTPVGPDVVTTVTVPAAPVLAVTKGGAPLDPPLMLTPLVDTVVMDRGAGEFLFLWRVTFPWEDRFEAATLEVA